MEETRPLLITSETEHKLPILILDKTGKLGVQLARELQEQFLVIIVSREEPAAHENIIHIPYRKKTPLIPDNSYSHIFVFYNGEDEILAMLPALAKKANDSRGKLLFITALPYSSKSLFQRLSHHAYYGVTKILYGEVITRGTIDNTVSLLLHQAVRLGRLEIPNHGMGKLYPVFLEDVLAGILTAAFADSKQNQTLLLFPHHPVGELSVARMLQKQNSMLKLDFSKRKIHVHHYFIPQEGVYAWTAYPLEEKLKKLFSDLSGELPQEKEPELRKKTIKQPVARKRNPFAFILLLLFLLCLPFLIVAFAGVSGMGALQVSVRELEQGKLDSALRSASIAQAAFSVATTVGEKLFYIDSFAGDRRQKLVSQLLVAKTVSEVELDIARAALLAKPVFMSTSKNPKSDFLQATLLTKNALITLQKLQAENGLPREVATKLSAIETVLVPFANTIDALPNILGFTGKKTYLVLFQNNMELRPGGGFIGSYGLLTLDQGRVNEFKIFDVYDADGKLTKHIEPPFQLRRYLGASHWFLRDSNFALDNEENAAKAREFFKLETGTSVDGVLAVDTTFLRNLLSVTGPVVVADYKETVTEDNFYLLTQNHAEKNFFPGSTQKKDFLRSLLDSLTSRLSQGKNLSGVLFLKQLGESIRGKHVLFAFSDKATQRLFTVNNLSSSLFDGREREGNSFLDFLGVVDSNLGANKTNYYLKRSLEHALVVSEKGDVEATVSATYTNTSKKDSAFGGDYKNYVRFILPAHAVLEKVMVNSDAPRLVDAVTDPAVFTAKQFSPPQGLEIEKTETQGKSVIGFFVVVTMGETKKVTLTYKIAKAVDANAPAFIYDLQLFKQPGTIDDPYSLSLSYPSAFRLIQANKGISDLGGKLVYSSPLIEDKELRAEFSRK